VICCSIFVRVVSECGLVFCLPARSRRTRRSRCLSAGVSASLPSISSTLFAARKLLKPVFSFVWKAIIVRSRCRIPSRQRWMNSCSVRSGITRLRTSRWSKINLVHILLVQAQSRETILALRQAIS